MSVKEQESAYEICKIRGHQSSAITLASNPSWSVCKHCGTHYRIEMRTIEQNVPRSTDTKSAVDWSKVPEKLDPNEIPNGGLFEDPD